MLKELMEALVRDVHAKCLGLDHETLCEQLAQKYQLWNEDGCFPIWLSRVVDGAIRDYTEGVSDV